MKEVLRHPLNFGVTRLTVSEGAKLVLFGGQHRQGRQQVSIWLEEDITRPPENRVFCVLPTGSTAPPQWNHVMSAIMPDDFHVYHLYEEKA